MDAINRLLAAAYNPVDASQRALDVGTRAADFVASANALLGELESEANALRASGATESDPRVAMLAKDVCLETMQSVEVAASIGAVGGGCVRSTQEPKALAMFCIAHAGMGVEMMNDNHMEGRNLDHGELTEWTDANAEERFKAMHGEAPPSYD